MLSYLAGLSLYVGLLATLVRLLPQSLSTRFTVPLYVVSTLLLAASPWLYLLADLSWRLPIPSLCVLSIGLASGVSAWRKLAAAKAFSFGAVVAVVSGLLTPMLFNNLWLAASPIVMYQNSSLTINLENYQYSGIVYDSKDFVGCKQLVAYQQQLFFWEKQIGQKVVCPQSPGSANELTYSAALAELIAQLNNRPVMR